MIDEETNSFNESYNVVSESLYDLLDDLDGLGGAAKALVFVADDLNFDKEDLQEILEKYISEIYL